MGQDNEMILFSNNFMACLQFYFLHSPFWKGLTCLVNATMPRMYQEQCLARMKQLVFLHSDTILDSLQYILEFQLRFDADPLTCSGKVIPPTLEKLREVYLFRSISPEPFDLFS